jgi:hypothetical protein
LLNGLYEFAMKVRRKTSDLVVARSFNGQWWTRRPVQWSIGCVVVRSGAVFWAHLVMVPIFSILFLRMNECRRKEELWLRKIRRL